jgi:serine/threonine protein kinase
MVIGAWEVRQEIGRGAFATVYRGCNTRTGQQVAVKEINTDKLNAKLKQSLESEVTILRRIQHQNIVHLYDVLQVRISCNHGVRLNARACRRFLVVCCDTLSCPGGPASFAGDVV